MTSKGTPAFSRRHLVVGTAAAGVGAALPGAAGAQATPNATPAVTPAASPVALDPATVFAVSQALVGGGTLADAALPPLVDLLAVEPGIEGVVRELSAIAEMTPEALAAASPEARAVATNILTYWYQGQYDGAPVANRADIFFQFAAWQTLPYMTQPTLCKAFGYWAADVMPS